jgi:hypothetical protein
MPKNFFFEMTYDKFKKTADYRKAAIATLKYIATRENQQGEEMNRTLFGRERMYQLDEAIGFVNALQMKQLRLWHVTWSPAPVQEINEKKDLDLRKIARETMTYLQTIDPTIEFIVAEHNDHSEIAHVQGLVFVNGWISRDDLIEMGKSPCKRLLNSVKVLIAALISYRFYNNQSSALLKNHVRQSGLSPRYRPPIDLSAWQEDGQVQVKV